MNFVSNCWRRSVRAAAMTLWLTAGACGAGWAQGLVVQDLRDESSAATDISSDYFDQQFRSRVETNTPSFDGSRADVVLRHSWSFATRTAHLLSQDTFGRELGWAVTLQVLDPDRRSFDLSVDHRLVGILGAGQDPIGIAAASLPGLEIWVYEAFATQPRRLPTLSTAGAEVDDGNDVNVTLVERSGRASVGRYEGTQSFLFFLKPSGPAVTKTIAFAGGPDVYSWLQFGRPTSDLDLAFANPGAGAPQLHDLGQFVTFRVDYAAAPVPEPATAALLAAGLLFTLRQSRRRRA